MVLLSWVTTILFYVLAYNINESRSSTLNLKWQNSTLTRVRRQSACPYLQSRCGSGECLPEDLFCDGKVDCRDGSDETLTTCGKNTCPGLSFRCSYGACVSGQATCDGKKDCADNSDELLATCDKITSTNKCGAGKFACTNGECIESYDVCDGIPTCSDGSDETVAVCGGTDCDARYFRCEYGACVDGSAKCNHKQECADGSDESFVLCGPGFGSPNVTPVPTQPPITGSSVGCVLPPIPSHGRYTVNGQSNFSPGTRVRVFTVLEFSCETSFELNGKDSDVSCTQRDGKPDWNRRIPLCLQTCPPLTATTLEIDCSRDGQFVNCSKPMLPDTIAQIKCKQKHQATYFVNGIIPEAFNTLRCSDGSWDKKLIQCIPECGRRVPQGTPFVIGGEEVANLTEFPWHVGLYLKSTTSRGEVFNQLCGGTIVSSKIIISAAHCFDRGGRDPKDYGIGAGKYHRKWDTPEDRDAQLRMVSNIIIPTKYKGSQNSYSNDIAVVIVVNIFEINEVVAPICMDWNNQDDAFKVTPAPKGWVAGWGLTSEGGDASKVLKKIELEFIPYQECWDNSIPDFQPFVGVADKICAGRRATTQSCQTDQICADGQNVCEGDSGGGLAIPERPDSYIFYLQGIVSIGSEKSGSCDANRFATFTKVSAHMKWLKQLHEQFTPTY